MRTFDELEAMWAAAAPPPRERGSVRLLCVRREPGLHETPAAVELTVEQGVVGDRWAHGWESRDPARLAQVTLMNATAAELVTAGVQPLHEPGDNILVDFDISADHLPAGTHLQIGDAILVVSPEPHSGCARFAGRFGKDALRWANSPRWRERRLRGMNTSVVRGGTVRVGDTIEVLS